MDVWINPTICSNVQQCKEDPIRVKFRSWRKQWWYLSYAKTILWLLLFCWSINVFLLGLMHVRKVVYQDLELHMLYLLYELKRHLNALHNFKLWFNGNTEKLMLIIIVLIWAFSIVRKPQISFLINFITTFCVRQLNYMAFKIKKICTSKLVF